MGESLSAVYEELTEEEREAADGVALLEEYTTAEEEAQEKKRQQEEKAEEKVASLKKDVRRMNLLSNQHWKLPTSFSSVLKKPTSGLTLNILKHMKIANGPKVPLLKPNGPWRTLQTTPIGRKNQMILHGHMKSCNTQKTATM